MTKNIFVNKRFHRESKGAAYSKGAHLDTGGIF